MPKLKSDTAGWTYGVEHELADWDTRKGWEGYGRDPEPNICNSNGIAGDPTLKDYPFGAEINTPPTSSPNGQGDLLTQFLKRHEHVYVSQRVGMHVHVRVPGLRENLQLLQRLQRYVTENKRVFQLMDPVPYYDRSDFESEEDYKMSRRWVQYIRRSHWTTIPINRVDMQCKATSVSDFFRLEAPVTKVGQKPMFHAQPRAAVNLRQLLQTDTIEFRSFFQPLDPGEVVTAVEWCRDFLLSAFDNASALDLFNRSYAKRKFPAAPTFEPWIERRWEATSHSKNKRDVVLTNIKRILAEEFDDVSTEHLSHLDWSR